MTLRQIIHKYISWRDRATVNAMIKEIEDYYALKEIEDCYWDNNTTTSGSYSVQIPLEKK